MPVIKASAKITRQQWQNLKLSSIGGSTDKELAKSYGISEGSIRRTRSLDREWAAAYTKVRLTIKSKQKEQDANQIAEITNTTIASLDGLGKGTNVIVARMGAIALKKFARKAPKLNEWSEASTAFNMVRKATGQDKEGSSTVVNLGAFWSSPSSSTDAATVVDA